MRGVLAKLGFAFEFLVPVPVENIMMGTEEKILKLLDVVAKRALEEYGVAAHYAVRGLQDDLHTAQLIPPPALPDVAAVRLVGRLVPHWKRPDSDAQFFVKGDIEPHALEEIGRGVVEVIQHVV